MIQPPPSGRKGTVSILGHKVSTDALLLALASVVVIIFLYRKQAGPGVSAGAPMPIDGSGNGLAFAPLPTNSTISSTPPPASTPPGFTPPTGETLTGSGYGPASASTILTDAAGHQYEEVFSGPGSHLEGVSVYYQPAPGVFSLGPGQPGGPGFTGTPGQLAPGYSWLAPGTPLFVQLS